MLAAVLCFIWLTDSRMKDKYIINVNNIVVVATVNKKEYRGEEHGNTVILTSTKEAIVNVTETMDEVVNAMKKCGEVSIIPNR